LVGKRKLLEQRSRSSVDLRQARAAQQAVPVVIYRPSGASAWRGASLEICIKPAKGPPISRIRKIALATDWRADEKRNDHDPAVSYVIRPHQQAKACENNGEQMSASCR